MKGKIGLIGLGVMGKSLGRNLARNGFNVSLYNRHVKGSEEHVAVNFVKEHSELNDCLPFDNLKAFVESLDRPRKIILMVNAGPTVDMVLKDLSDFLSPDDIVIDGGNSHFEETKRRIDELLDRKIHFVGTGISGGEEGALNGPAIMPSGDQQAYSKVSSYLEKIAARNDEGNPCCGYIGKEGSGHFVKMVHNGIEYVEMQLLAECYAILKNQGKTNEEIAAVFQEWSKDLASYLLNITIDILRKKEGENYLLDQVLDKAGNKGTGSWTTAYIAGSGEPATQIPSALFARYLSFFKEKRVHISGVFETDRFTIDISPSQLKDAYQFARIINHHQGFSIIRHASEENGWEVNLSQVAKIWTGGCIIKSDLMTEIAVFLGTNQDLLMTEEISEVIKQTYPTAKLVSARCLEGEVHAPCLIDAVNFLNGLKTASSPANLIQAQRDYFGAHTYQRVDDPSGKSHHSDWS